MTTSNQWQDFYDRHAPYYDRGAFTHHTEAEVEFLLSVLDLPAGAHLLDVGCGTGRHAIALAQRGFRVTGVDLSAGMLLQGVEKARAAGATVEWVHADATAYVAREPVDAVLCLCGSAFAMPSREVDPGRHDGAILDNIAASLKPDGQLVLTTPNGYRRIREVTPEQVASGTFDTATMVWETDSQFPIGGVEGTVSYKERLYILPELVTFLGDHGFRVEHTWGGTAGRWGRRPLELDEIEAMVVARRVRT
ncbi:MAG: class I SAM-dependent methyltransferase [Dehalococcoidia bacterium]